ncbi:alpha/beta hydrolase [candidate division KSB1 bacterium]|nr:alpha/beta hydrolase [candidate division KSB1 bacterium]
MGFVLFSLIYVSVLSAQPETPVTFVRDSLQLVGMLHLPAERTEPVPAVLMLHGFTGNKTETHSLYTRLARQLATQGIAALRFDFAGSAFFDALASDRGVVLIDMGTRPRDANSFDDLNQRCEVITCKQGPGNRFRLDTDHLGEAIERAATAREWPEGFFETYFHG